MIEKSFGKDVARLVAEVTDDKQLDKAERKHLQIENASHKSARAKILKLADKTSNLGALATSPAADWSIKRRLEYLKWARDVAAGLRGAALVGIVTFGSLAGSMLPFILQKLKFDPAPAPRRLLSRPSSTSPAW